MDIIKPSIINFVLYFILYIIMHYAICYIDEKIEIEDKTIKKSISFLAKWFPAIYTILIILTIYF